MLKRLYKITYNVDTKSYSFHHYENSWEVITDVSKSKEEVEEALFLLGANLIADYKQAELIYVLLYAL